jgi:hypothetical protein
MRNLFAVVAVAFVGSIVLSQPLKYAAADQPAQPPAPPPAPPPPPKVDCASCIQCVGACGTAYADCTRKCFAQPDFPSQQACVAACPTVVQCAQACPCSGCANIPGLPH